MSLISELCDTEEEENNSQANLTDTRTPQLCLLSVARNNEIKMQERDKGPEIEIWNGLCSGYPRWWQLLSKIALLPARVSWACLKLFAKIWVKSEQIPEICKPLGTSDILSRDLD